ncbi:hypothetical protein F4801DRAFT_572210 [Xylaria longipes]|nr:hypothetical protein F4801DRAFT_572210 [Xylaria longipes]
MAGKSKNNKQALLLTLPHDIREIIYKYVGVPVDECIRLMPWQDGLPFGSQRRSRWIPRAHYLEGWVAAWRLLCSCKLINSELHLFLYASNTIVVCDEHVEYGLDFLRHMPPEHCQNLRDLYVYLQLSNTGWVDEKDKIPRLRTVLKMTPEKVQAWQKAAQYVLSHASPGVLTLHLVCESHKDEFIHDALQPLLAAAGTLKACELRFDSVRCPKLSALARESALRIEGRSVEVEFRKKPFRFFDLPPEIRIAILKYTDLVTPGCQVGWGDGRLGFWVDFYDDRNRKPPRRLVDAAWAQTLMRSKPLRYCNTMKSERNASYDFCIRRRSAYSARCKCWMAPRDLFLVSRAFYADAIHVLYSCNRINIPSSRRTRDPFSTKPLVNLDASQFIMLPKYPQCFQHLRTLEITIPRIYPEFELWRSDHIYFNWVSSIERLKTYANLPSLTLVVCSQPFDNDFPPVDGVVTDMDMVVKQSLERIYESLIPLRALRGVRRLFIHFEWNWHWSSPSENNDWAQPTSKVANRGDIPREHVLVTDLEQIFEKLIMGDDYDSMAVGKADEIPSEWMISRRKLYI